MSRGIDCSVPTTEVAGCLKRAGYTWIGRYLHVGSPNALTRAEAEHAASLGLYLVSLRETNPTHPGFFTYAEGKFDGMEALRGAAECKQPGETPIYFTVDYDAAETDLSAITAYFQGVRSVVMETYLVGVYGSGRVCAAIKGGGWAHYAWLAESRGWAGSAGYAEWDIRQVGTTAVCGIAVDTDEAAPTGGGGWRPAS